MPCLLKIKIIRARSLPVMDRQSSKADAYVEIRFANQYPLRTSIARRTLDPVWNENFRLEINDDAYLQNEPLEFRLLDYDSITANDLIGSVYIDLNSLLADEFETNQPHMHSSCKSESMSLEAKDDDIPGDLAQDVIVKAGCADEDLPAGTGTPASPSSVLSVRSSDTSSHEGFIGETTGVLNTYTRTLGGWFPIYDTMCGIRGELKCQIILQYFGDVNPFNSSSAGIQVFSTPSPYLPLSPPVSTLGFISSIVTHIDPEYHWTDSFRTPRASNEARVRVLHKITGLLRRRMGRKALEMSANAIIGYRQWFDFEIEEKTITGRAVGTAVRIGAQKSLSRRRASSTHDLVRAAAGDNQAPLPADFSNNNEPENAASSDQHHVATTLNRKPVTPPCISSTNSISDSDAPNATETDASSAITQSTSSSLSTSSLQSADNARNQKNAAACEIVTFKSFPPGVIHRLGGLVSATSVKLIENDQSRTRELWFDDLRAEIKHHALAIGCSHIVGYTEQVTIRDEIIMLVAYGTAAILDFNPGAEKLNAVDELDDAGHNHASATALRVPPDIVGQPWQLDAESPRSRPMDPLAVPLMPPLGRRLSRRQHRVDALDHGAEHEHRAKPLGCRMCHASHDRQKLPYPMRFFRCGYCQKKAVPEILLSTIDIPFELDVIDGESCMIEAHICRPGSKSAQAAKPGESDNAPNGAGAGSAGGDGWRWFGMGKGQNAGPDSKLSGEAYAAHISDALPFIHYDLHRQLLYKLSVHGMNAIFGLKYQFSIGEDMVIAVATGTAVYVTGLPTPGPLHIKRNIDVLDDEDRSFMRIQDRIMRLSIANRRRLDRAFRKKRRAMIRHREQQQLPQSGSAHVLETSIASGDRRRRGSHDAQNHLNGHGVGMRRRRYKSTGDQSDFDKGSAGGEDSDVGENDSGSDSGSDSERKEVRKSKHTSHTGTPVSNSSADSDSSASSSSRADRAEARRQRKIRARVAVQIDDDADEDLMAALLDIPLPPSFLLCNVERPPLFRSFFSTEAREFGLVSN
ncbi:hypothetical protein GGI04_004043, partial [Coemansia thaxteri]